MLFLLYQPILWLAVSVATPILLGFAFGWLAAKWAGVDNNQAREVGKATGGLFLIALLLYLFLTRAH